MAELASNPHLSDPQTTALSTIAEALELHCPAESPGVLVKLQTAESHPGLSNSVGLVCISN